jgi:hypothetical protein
MVHKSQPSLSNPLGRIWIFQQDEKPLELGTSNNVRGTDILAISEILDEITLTFSKDGQKLIFIDNRVQSHTPLILTLRESRKYSQGLSVVGFQGQVYIVK